jgi:hypothetical protein
LSVLSVLLVLCVGAVWLVVNKVSRKRDGGPAAMTPSESPLSGEQAYQRLIRCTVLIVSPHGVGSGFVADTEKRLVVTNFHVVGRERRVSVVFPRYDARGELLTDAGRYDLRAQSTEYNGEVLKVDTRRDLALVRVASLSERAAAVPLAKQPAATGSVVYSVGGSGAKENLLWRLTKGTVRGRVHRTQEADFGTLDCMVLETDSPVNPGDSGGPVINDRGELVAVVSHGHRLAQLVSGNIDADEVRALLRGGTGSDAPHAPILPSGSNNRGKIEGTEWTSLRGFVKGQDVPAGTLRLEFDRDGGMTYHTPLGEFRGTYALERGDSVVWTFTMELGGSKRHSQTCIINGNRMTVRDSDGTSLNFRKVN